MSLWIESLFSYFMIVHIMIIVFIFGWINFHSRTAYTSNPSNLSTFIRFIKPQMFIWIKNDIITSIIVL